MTHWQQVSLSLPRCSYFVFQRPRTLVQQGPHSSKQLSSRKCTPNDIPRRVGPREEIQRVGFTWVCLQLKHNIFFRRDHVSQSRTSFCVCCVFSSHSFWTSMDVPAGVTQEEGNTGFSIHLLSAVLALIFLARRIQPFLSLVDREVEFCVLPI